MFSFLEDVPLVEDVADFTLLNDDFFFHALDGVEMVGGVLAAQDHLAHVAFAQNLEELKVFKGLKKVWEISYFKDKGKRKEGGNNVQFSFSQTCVFFGLSCGTFRRKGCLLYTSPSPRD